jgi:tetratricopeptide (TPR) repeat protein
VSVELIDARTDTHAWAETYDGNVADVLAFQSEIAQRITNQLGAKLSPRESTELASRPTHDSAAFESYIRARALMEISDADRDDDKLRDDYTRAVQFLEQAVARDPKFAAAYWALTEANIQLFRHSDPPNPEYRARAEAALKEAHRLAPEAGETLHAEARVIYYGYRDFRRALTTLERAAKLLPNSAEVTLTRAFLYRRFGRWQEAYAQFERATELNPQDPTGYYSAADIARGLRWWDEADRVRARLIKRFPRMARGARIEEAVQLRWSGEVDAGDKILEELNLDVRSDFAPLFYRSFWKRDYQECRRLLAEAAKYPELERDRWEKELKLAFVTKTPGPKQAALEAEKQLEERLRHPSSRDDQGELTDTLSCVKFILGKKQEALRLCEQSVEKHPLSEDALVNGAPSEVAGLRLYLRGRRRARVAELRKTRADPIWGILWGAQVRASLRRAPHGPTLRRNPEAIATAVSAIVVEGTPTPCAPTGEPKELLLLWKQLLTTPAGKGITLTELRSWK